MNLPTMAGLAIEIGAPNTSPTMLKVSIGALGVEFDNHKNTAAYCFLFVILCFFHREAVWPVGDMRLTSHKVSKAYMLPSASARQHFLRPRS